MCPFGIFREDLGKERPIKHVRERPMAKIMTKAGDSNTLLFSVINA